MARPAPPRAVRNKPYTVKELSMIAIFLSVLAVAAAAPQYYHRHPPPPPSPFQHNSGFGLQDRYFDDDVFDTRRFWSELSVELRKFDDMLQDFYKRFPSSVSSEGLDGNQYKITITLSGFEEKDIVVKAREGFLMVQAVHKNEEGSEKNYLDLRSLPTNLNLTGTWTFENEVLTIVFPVIGQVEEKATEPSVSVITNDPERSREEIDSEGTSRDVVNADIETTRGDRDREVETNEIPSRSSVEATTYAVDVNNDVEFVPARY